MFVCSVLHHSENMSSARSTPKSVMDTSQPPSVEMPSSSRPVPSPGMHLSSPPPSVTPTLPNKHSPLSPVHESHPHINNSHPMEEDGGGVHVDGNGDGEGQRRGGGEKGMEDLPPPHRDADMPVENGARQDKRQGGGESNTPPTIILSHSVFNLLQKKGSQVTKPFFSARPHQNVVPYDAIIILY